MRFRYQDIINDSIELSKKIDRNKYKAIFGIPSGGILPAYIIAQELKLLLIDEEQLKFYDKKEVLVVDDLIDTGRTLEKYPDHDQAVLYKKDYSPEPHFYIKTIPDEWLLLPHDKSESGIQEHLVRILEYIGENPNRIGLLETPRRIEKMYAEIYRGYNLDLKPNITVFPNGQDGISYDEMITDEGTYFSTCEHHGLPFFGKYYFAYIPNKNGLILGLSKIARMVDYCSAKMQIQERLTNEIVDEIEKALCVNKNKPLGIALVMKGEHLCKTMRGARKKGIMTTSVMRGVFKTKSETRSEFLKLVS